MVFSWAAVNEQDREHINQSRVLSRQVYASIILPRLPASLPRPDISLYLGSHALSFSNTWTDNPPAWNGGV